MIVYNAFIDGKIEKIIYERGDLVLQVKTAAAISSGLEYNELTLPLLLRVHATQREGFAGKIVEVISLIEYNTGTHVKMTADELFRCSDPITL